MVSLRLVRRYIEVNMQSSNASSYVYVTQLRLKYFLPDLLWIPNYKNNSKPNIVIYYILTILIMNAWTSREEPLLLITISCLDIIYIYIYYARIVHNIIFILHVIPHQ